MTEVTDAAIAAALAKRAELLADRPTPTHLSDESLVRQMLQAALPRLVPPPGPDLTVVPWRVGRHEPVHLYAQLGPEPSDSDPPLGTLFTAELAAEAVAARNERLKCHRCGHRIMRAGYSPSGWTHWAPPWERPGWEGILCPSGGEAGPVTGAGGVGRTFQ